MRRWLVIFLASVLPVAADPLADWLEKPADGRDEAPEVALDEARAREFRDRIAEETLARLKAERAAEVEAKEIAVGGRTLRWLEKEFGKAAEGKRSLWISLHGGGTGPAAMNDQQWRNQIGLYRLKEGICIAPRAPENAWNMWHLDYMDGLFDRLIADMIATRGVDPDRVFLLGYSAGGDGVWQLAPRLADRFAAAAMMAGHPGDASLLPLRNLPFAIFMGGEDAAYDRNKLAAEKGKELEALRKADPQGYPHLVKIYRGMPHWMDGKDAEAIPWMAKHTREPWPKKVVWVQDDVLHDRFYWLEIPPGAAKQGARISAAVEGNAISLEGDVPAGMKLYLSDRMVDLDAEVTVTINGKPGFRGKVERSPRAIVEALAALPDAARCPFAVLRL